MFKLFLTLGLSLALVLPVEFAAHAQAPANGNGQNSEEAPATSGPRKQLATIIFSGLAGAILGLSTLSFYGRPQEKLSNIAIGFAVGVIAGTVFTAYQAAVRPYELYQDPSTLEGMITPEPTRWSLRESQSWTPGLKLQWDF